jgi:hypothetical protein
MTVRLFIDLIFCDRLDRLQDHNANTYLNWLPEASLSTKIPNSRTIITGRADWVLAYDANSPLDSALVVL